MNDPEFLDRLRNQDPAAVRHLTECYLPSVWRFVYVQVDGDSHLAEDIVSETVVALVRAVGSDATIEHPSAWLRSVAQRRVQDHYRAVARVQHLVSQAKYTTSLADENDAVKQQELREKRDAIRQIMDELSEQHRIALEWKYLENLNVRQIAARWDTTEKAVESILFRARNDFRERMIRREQDEERSCGNGVSRAAPKTENANAVTNKPPGL